MAAVDYEWVAVLSPKGKTGSLFGSTLFECCSMSGFTGQWLSAICDAVDGLYAGDYLLVCG